MAAHDSVDAARPFDYDAVAELFPARNRKFNRQITRYRRFDSAAEALRFAMEELPPQLLQSAWLEVEEERFDANAMRRLYDSVAFPLARRAAA
jgi:Arc/MetJ-type ribon-helix-helix transcriptional regulator